MAAKQWASREGRPNAGPQTWSSSMSAADLECEDQLDGKGVVRVRVRDWQGVLYKVRKNM
jgi:hypothetical protein